MRKFGDYAAEKKVTLDEYNMIFALRAAEDAKSRGEKAVGAALCWVNHQPIADCSSEYEEGDCTGHAVINVLRKATQMFTRRMDEAVLYTTVEPCLMCAMAAHYAGVKEMVFGCYDVQNGFQSTRLLREDANLAFVARGGVMAEQCYEMVESSHRANLRLEE